MQIEGKLAFVFGIANQMSWMNMAFLSLVCFLRFCIDETSCYVVWKKEPPIQLMWWASVSLCTRHVRERFKEDCSERSMSLPCWVVIAMFMIRLRHSEMVSKGIRTHRQCTSSTLHPIRPFMPSIWNIYYTVFPFIFSLVGVGVVAKISSMVFDDLLVGSPLFLPKNERTMTSDSLPKLGSKSVARVAWGPWNAVRFQVRFHAGLPGEVEVRCVSSPKVERGEIRLEIYTFVFSIVSWYIYIYIYHSARYINI